MHDPSTSPCFEPRHVVFAPGFDLATLRTDEYQYDTPFTDGDDTNRYEPYISVLTKRMHRNFVYHLLLRILHAKLEWDGVWGLFVVVV